MQADRPVACAFGLDPEARLTRLPVSQRREGFDHTRSSKLPDQDVTEATTATVPEESGEAYEANPEAIDAARGRDQRARAETAEAADAAPDDGRDDDDDEEGQNELVVLDDLGGQSFADAVDATIVEFDDGDIVTGRVVKIDSDEVLLDIGFKSEGVIPSRELSIRNDVDPHEIVSLDDELEALVLQKEDKDGRLILSKKRAQYERAWGTIEEIKEKDGIVKGPVIEVVKGGLILDIGLRGFLPASLVDLRRVRDLQPYVGPRDRVQDHRARQEPQQRRALTSRVPRGDPARAA